MKGIKYTMLLTACFGIALCGLSACSDDDDPKGPEPGLLHIDIDPVSVYKQMDYYSEIAACLDKQALGVTIMVYDESKALVASDVAISSELKALSVDFPDLKGGNYTVVAVQQVSDENKIGLWKFKDPENLATFRVMSERFPLPDYSLLAIDTQKVTIDGDATLSVTPQSMGSIVFFGYNGLLDDIDCTEVFLSTTNRARGLWMDPDRSSDDRLWRDEDAATGLPYYLAQVEGEGGQRPPTMGIQSVFTIDEGVQSTAMGFSDDYYLEETRVDFTFEHGTHYYFLYVFDQPEGSRWFYGEGKIL